MQKGEYLGIATHSGHFGIYPPCEEFTERIYSGGKFFRETIVLTLNINKGPNDPPAWIRIKVNDAEIEDGLLENVISESRTWKLHDVKTIDILLKTKGSVVGDYMISVPL